MATRHRILNATERTEAKAPAEGENVHRVAARRTRTVLVEASARLVGAGWICHRPLPRNEAALYRGPTRLLEYGAGLRSTWCAIARLSFLVFQFVCIDKVGH